MTDIFLSYDSGDRERVRPVRDALAAQGFDVLWEQDAPAEADWENWVRKRLARCRCVVALQSAASTHSNKMRHVEALAEEQGKLIVVHLEPLSPRQGEAGASASGLNLATWLANWHGDLERPEWQELRRRIEAKLKSSLWVQRLMHEVASERTHWRAKYETSAGRCKSLNDELARERSERGAAQDRAAGLQAQLGEEAEARGKLEARIVALEQHLAGAKGTHAEALHLLREELRQKGLQLAEAQAALSREQSEGGRLKTELQAVEKASGELKARLTDLEVLVTEREARIVGLKADSSQRDAEIASLKAGTVDRDASIASLMTSIVQRDARVADLKAKAAERDAYIAELEAGLAQRDAFIADLTANAADQNAYIVKLEANLAQRHTYIASLKANIAELEKRTQDAMRGHEPAPLPPPQFSIFSRAMLTTIGLAGIALSIVKVRQS